MDHFELLEKLKKDTQRFGDIIWDALTPFERDRLLKRLNKQMQEIQNDDETAKPDSKIEVKSVVEQAPEPERNVELTEIKENKFNEWDIKTKYRVAFADMIEQRTTMMKFLLDRYGIEAVEQFFLHNNPEWAEKLKVGKMKKIFAKMLSKLLPKTILTKLSNIVIENGQYLVGVEHINVPESTDDRRIIQITDCPVKKQFKKTIKSLKFNEIEERYICSFACVPVLAQMCAVGNCNLNAEYLDKEKGCNLIVTLKAKRPELLEQDEAKTSVILKNGPS